MIKGATVIAIILALTAVALAQEGCTGTPNTQDVWSGDLKLVKTSKNGKLYMSGEEGNQIPVLHMWGTAYEMGFAQGTLLKDEVQALYTNFFKYLDEQIEEYVTFLPEFLLKILEEEGVPGILDATALMTEKYTPQHYFDEMKGLADASGIEYRTILQLQMFPEVIKAACSMYGAWGAATANTSSPGSLYQLRALDFGVDSPLVNYPLVTVYHPSDEGHSFSTLTWVGFVGAISGYSGDMGISEKVWLHYNGTSSRIGAPFHFVLRDILQFDTTLDDSVDRMVNSRRTCSIFVGIGSKSDKQFRACEYAHEIFEVFDDKNYPAYQPAHPLLEGAVYIDKHTQPSNNPCMGTLMQQHYGSLDFSAALDIVSRFQTGDLHIAFYDFADNRMYVSVARPNPNNATDVTKAYDRPFLSYDMTMLNQKNTQ